MLLTSHFDSFPYFTNFTYSAVCHAILTFLIFQTITENTGSEALAELLLAGDDATSAKRLRRLSSSSTEFVPSTAPHHSRRHGKGTKRTLNASASTSFTDVPAADSAAGASKRSRILNNNHHLNQSLNNSILSSLSSTQRAKVGGNKRKGVDDEGARKKVTRTMEANVVVAAAPKNHATSPSMSASGTTTTTIDTTVKSVAKTIDSVAENAVKVAEVMFSVV